MSSLFQQLTENPGMIDQVLYPGKQISDFDPNNLQVEVLPSGFNSFDKNFVLKKNRGELILIGARPSHGKSALLFQMAYNVAQYGKSHVFSLEMDHDSVVTRQIAAVINRPIDAVQRGLHPETIMKAQIELKKLNMHVDDRSGITVEEICYSARQENKRSRTDAIFIDYIQIIPTEKGHSRANELANVSAQLKALGKELRVPIIVASQLNRNNESREDKTPQLSDLKESGALEQDADVVILLHRDTKNSAAEAKVIIAKNRNGPTSEITMEYAPAQTRFLDTDDGI
jgi:replicative DNA helicase